MNLYTYMTGFFKWIQQEHSGLQNKGKKYTISATR